MRRTKENEKEVGRDPKKVEQLAAAWKAAIANADQYVIPNQFGEIVESQGGVGLNASTDLDETLYSIHSRKTGWSCGPIWNQNALFIPCCGSFTKNVTW